MADRPADLRHLHRMGEPGPVEVVFARQEHLGLRLELAEGVRVDDPVAVDLEGVPIIGLAGAAVGLPVEIIVERVGHRSRLACIPHKFRRRSAAARRWRGRRPSPEGMAATAATISSNLVGAKVLWLPALCFQHSSVAVGPFRSTILANLHRLCEGCRPRTHGLDA